MDKNELITYDMLKASLKFLGIGYSDCWCEVEQEYRISFNGDNDIFVFQFYEDGTLKSSFNYW